jgi:hypothetical protein
MESRRAEQVLPGGVGASGRVAHVGRGCRRVYTEPIYCVHMYVNGKMRLVETIPRMGWEVEKNDGGGKFNYDIL